MHVRSVYKKTIPRSMRCSVVRPAFTLLEVMLALAILGGALAIIGELMRLGTRSANAARDMTTAQLYAESKMAEVIAGVMPAQPTMQTPYEMDDDWLYSITTGNTTHDGLLMVEVTMTQNQPAQARPISFALTRWFRDPNRVLAMSSNSATSSSTTSSTSSGSATSGTAGGSSSGTSAGS